MSIFGALTVDLGQAIPNSMLCSGGNEDVKAGRN
jgi:hypothetical protein